MRERLLQAAMELMKQRGLKFTVAELAARLGTSKRTIYEHFESKEQLIGVMVDEVIAELMEAEQEIYRDNRLTAAQKLRAILTLMPKGMQLSDNRLISDLMRFAPEEWRKVDRLLQEEWGTVRKIIEEGMAAGEFRPLHAQTLVQLMKGATASLYDQDFLMHTDSTLAEAVQTMADAFLNGMALTGTERVPGIS